MKGKRSSDGHQRFALNDNSIAVHFPEFADEAHAFHNQAHRKASIGRRFRGIDKSTVGKRGQGPNHIIEARR